jgi:hypothetical protein
VCVHLLVERPIANLERLTRTPKKKQDTRTDTQTHTHTNGDGNMKEPLLSISERTIGDYEEEDEEEESKE